jgi:hypothetical protein
MNSVALPGIALAHQPRADQFRIGVDSYPSPSASNPECVFSLGWNVLVLRSHKAPDFVALNPLTWQVHQRFIEASRTGRAKLDQQLRNRVFGNAKKRSQMSNGIKSLDGYSFRQVSVLQSDYFKSQT